MLLGFNLGLQPRRRATASAPANPWMSAWFAGGISGKKIAVVGDSTSDLSANALPFNTRITQKHKGAVTGPLAGVTILDFGSSGQTTTGFIADAGAKGFTAAKAAAANLYYICYGINNRRANAISVAQTTIDLRAIINGIRQAVPTAAIILHEPLAFLTTDVGAAGYVVPNGSAQAYSNELRDIYRSLAAEFGLASFLPFQALYGGETSVASSVNMSDQIHPSTTGYDVKADFLAALAGYIAPIDAAASAAAVATSYANAVSIYPRAVEDPTYWDLIADGHVGSIGLNAGFVDPFLFARGLRYTVQNNASAGATTVAVTGDTRAIPQFSSVKFASDPYRVYSVASAYAGGAGNITLTTPLVAAVAGGTALSVSGPYDANVRTTISAGDYVQQDTGTPWEIPFGFNTSQLSATQCRLFSLGGSLPPAAQTNGGLRVWRHRYLRDPNIQSYAMNPFYNFVRYGRCTTAIAGTVAYIGTLPVWNAQLAKDWPVANGDVLIPVGVSPVTVASGFGINGNNLTISGAQVSASWLNKYCAIFGRR